MRYPGVSLRLIIILSMAAAAFTNADSPPLPNAPSPEKRSQARPFPKILFYPWRISAFQRDARGNSHLQYINFALQLTSANPPRNETGYLLRLHQQLADMAGNPQVPSGVFPFLCRDPLRTYLSIRNDLKKLDIHAGNPLFITLDFVVLAQPSGTPPSHSPTAWRFKVITFKTGNGSRKHTLRPLLQSPIQTELLKNGQEIRYLAQCRDSQTALDILAELLCSMTAPVHSPAEIITPAAPEAATRVQQQKTPGAMFILSPQKLWRLRMAATPEGSLVLPAPVRQEWKTPLHAPLLWLRWNPQDMTWKPSS
ncbi:MAG: hypothetical protein D6820_04250, partial [Lentisphaerae bacterium]